MKIASNERMLGTFWRSFGINTALLALAVLFFALPQPNLLSLHGFPLVAYFAFVPLFVLVRRVSFRTSFFWGAAYGTLSYCVFTYWLAVFHPLAMYVIATLYFFWLLVTVPLLKLVDMAFPKRGFILQWVIWIGYEYVKTLGFNGYSYGIIGYSQWTWTPIIQIASVFGVWGVSALVTFPSAWIAAGMKNRCTGPLRSWFGDFRRFSLAHRISALVWCCALASTFVFGFVSRVDVSAAETVQLALIQPNSDPWKGGINAYRRDFRTLTELTDEALAARADIDIVVWPETAFIPRIDWHYRYREERESFDLVSSLLTYLDASPVPVVLGNDDAILGPSDDGLIDRVDYNAVLLFTPGRNVIPPTPVRYRKMHLVPFTEHFPYKKVFPWVYDLLLANDTHFWEKGDDLVVFEAAGLRFSSPICFEDTFGYLSRRFVNEGARAIVNLTNDAWAKSEPCQYQHLSMAVFRTIENRVPLVRATASGQTAFVDPNGVVVSMAPSFSETWLVVDVPKLDTVPLTPYRLWGDLWGMAFAVAGLLSALTAIVSLSGLLTKLRNI